MGPQQAAADLTRLGELVRSRQREQATELEALHRRCLQACPPQEGERQSMAYRLRLLFLVELRFLLSTLLLDMKHDATDRFMRDTIRCCHGTERFFTAAPRSTSGKREDRMPDALVLDGGA